MKTNKYGIIKFIIFLLAALIIFLHLWGNPNWPLFFPVDIIIFVFLYNVIIRRFINYFRDTNLEYFIEKLPILRTQAVIVEKEKDEIPKPIGEEGKIEYNYRMILEFADGRRETFPVFQDLYNESVEGDKGILTYKQHGEQFYFVRFERQV